MSTDLLSLEHPSVLLFCLVQRKTKAENSSSEFYMTKKCFLRLLKDNTVIISDIYVHLLVLCKIEKVPRSIRDESRVKTWQVRGIWFQQLEHKQVPQWGTEPGVRKGKRSGWHGTPVANAPWKPLIIGEGQARYEGHEIGRKSDWLGSHC